MKWHKTLITTYWNHANSGKDCYRRQLIQKCNNRNFVHRLYLNSKIFIIETRSVRSRVTCGSFSCLQNLIKLLHKSILPALNQAVCSRIDEALITACEQVHAESVNRNTVGAVVGAAFSGRGLSGTGPKGRTVLLATFSPCKTLGITPLHYNTPRDLSDLAQKCGQFY